MSEQDTTLADLRAAMSAAANAYGKAKLEYENALIKAHPIQPGDILTASDGQEALVRTLFMEYGIVKIAACHRKKDGTFGDRLASLWRTEWENMKITKGAAP